MVRGRGVCQEEKEMETPEERRIADTVPRNGREEEADWVENLDPVTKKWYKEKKESEEGQVEKRLRKLR